MLPNPDIVVNHGREYRPRESIDSTDLTCLIKQDRSVLRRKDGPVLLSNVQGFGPGQLVHGERTEHGEVVAGEGADELVGAG